MSKGRKDHPRILVTGANGQLGMALRLVSIRFPEFEFVFAPKGDLDISIPSNLKASIERVKPEVVINCAAYTNVEKAELETERAFDINERGCHYLAETCEKVHALLVHISTDFVFDGSQKVPYKEADAPNPLNAYGASKLTGEVAILDSGVRCIIIRTSWLYSPFGHNFYRTMLRLAKEKGELTVVDDQVASPTSCLKLAEDLLRWLHNIIILTQPTEYGIFHYSHDGEASWFEFAREIMLQSGLNVPVRPVSSIEFPSKVKRPVYSKLANSRFLKVSGIESIDWRDALRQCILIDRQQEKGSSND